MAAALLAGGAAWFAGQSLGEVFTLTAEELKDGDALGQRTDTTLFLRGDRRVKTRDTALRLAILGGAVGLALGLAGGASRRSAAGALAGGGVGLVVGGGLAALASLAMVPIYLANFDPVAPGLMLPLLVLGVIGGAAGLGGGLALAVGRGVGPKGLAGPAIGGAIGALPGVFASLIVLTVAFPLASGELPIPEESAARLAAFALIALGIALAATRALPAPGAGRSPSPSPAPA